MIWKIASRSEPKKNSEKNEDSYRIGDDYVVLSDGISGKRHGEIASRMIVDSISEKVEDALSKKITESDLKQRLVQIVKDVNSEVLAFSSNHPEYQGMSATLDVLVKQNDKCYLCHVGDCAVYFLYKNEDFEKVTQDDTGAGQLNTEGLISEQMVLCHPGRNKMLKAIGMFDDLDIECKEYDLGNIKRIVVASDGITGYAIKSRIKEAVLLPTGDDVLNRLFELRKKPVTFAKLLKLNLGEEAPDIERICARYSDYDDGTAIYIENGEE
jgi:protein phosphatase